MTYKSVYIYLFMTSSLFCSDVDVTKYIVDLTRDKHHHTFYTPNSKIKVKNALVDKQMREVTDEQLVALLTTKSHYIELNECNDGEYVAHLNGRVNGGGRILGRIAYYTVKGVVYGAIFVGTIRSIVRSRRGAHPAEEVFDAAVSGLVNPPSFISMPDLHVADGPLADAIEGGLTAIASQTSPTVVGVPAVIAGATMNLMANASPEVDNFVRDAAMAAWSSAPKTASAFVFEGVPKVAPSFWRSVCTETSRRATGLIGIVEVIARGAEFVGNLVPGPI